MVHQFFHVQAGVHHDGAVFLGDEAGLLTVVLVIDLADDLFQDVFQGDEAGGAAVFVDDHGDLGFALHQVS